MIYFCADDYGLSEGSNRRIETCLTDGVLNKVSVLPNGTIADFPQRLSGAVLSLHLNLVEGRPLSNPQDIPLLVTPDGYFRHSFLGLLRLSLSPKRKELSRQLYGEIRKQIAFWKSHMGSAISLDSHQHTHMIPLVLKATLQAASDEGVTLQLFRLPAEPILPYLLTPSLYLSYRPTGLMKHWLLVFLSLFCRRDLKKENITAAHFMGAMFSGRMTEPVIKKLLPKYEKLGKDIEIALHPGYSLPDDPMPAGCRPGFEKFYRSAYRKEEFDALINFRKEG